MAEYKVEVDLSDLFDDMTINEQKNLKSATYRV